MAILDVIEFLDPTGQQIVHRVPEGGSGEFRLGSQLIVRESQVAVFFRDGKALDVFGPGRHTLSTQNIPLLANLISIPFGGTSPFRAEVVFVNMADFIGLKWGTPQPVTFRDEELGMVRLRANGTSSMAVADPQQFVNKIVGTQGLYDTNQIGDYLREIIVSRFNDSLGETMKSVLDLPSQYQELASVVRAGVLDDFQNLGLQLKQFFITSITPPDEVQKIIDQRTSMGAVGDMNRYMQFQAAQAIGQMGQGGGGAAGAGMETGAGLGAGMALGGAMAGMLNQSMQAGAGMAGAGQQQPQQQGGGQVANPTTAAEVQALLDNLDAQLAAGRISEGTYNTLTAKWQQRLQQMQGGGGR
jgi:membrane protease subunit (stomatin/prohibitin family)